MAKEKRLYLSSGVYFKLQNKEYCAFDVNHGLIPLTKGQRKMLEKLACNPNQIVSARSIYEYYSEEPVPEDTKCAGCVTKMKTTLPDNIKEFVKATYGKGYKLECELKEVPVEEQAPPFWNGATIVTELEGDYCGFYLDPLEGKKVLYAYIHITNLGTEESPQMMAYAALWLRSQRVLLDPKLAKIFSGPAGSYADAFERYKSGLSDNGKRCALLSGPVSVDGTMAHIHLEKRAAPESWHIMLNLDDYAKCARKRKDENDLYRGGMGVTVAYRTQWGTFFFRIGLVRRFFLKRNMIRDVQETKSRLKLLDETENAEWKALKISGHIDKVWYEWIMDSQDPEDDEKP